MIRAALDYYLRRMELWVRKHLPTAEEMTKEEHKELLEVIKIGNATLSRMEDHIVRIAT